MAYIQMPGFTNSLPHNMVHVPNSTDRRVQHLPLNKHVVDSTIIGTRQDRTSENHDLRVLQLANMVFFAAMVHTSLHTILRYAPLSLAVSPTSSTAVVGGRRVLPGHDT